MNVPIYPATTSDEIKKILILKKEILRQTHIFVKKRTDGTLIFEEQTYYKDGSITMRKITHYDLPKNEIALKMGILSRLKKSLPSNPPSFVNLLLESGKLISGPLAIKQHLDNRNDEYYGDLVNSNTVTSLFLQSICVGLSLSSMVKLGYAGLYILSGEDYEVISKPDEKKIDKIDFFKKLASYIHWIR